MSGQASDPCVDLLWEWQFRRELVNTYSRSLLLLALDDASRPEAKRELNEKLALALLALRHASDQLHACERDRVLASQVR
jgi:hypothetical protein